MKKNLWKVCALLICAAAALIIAGNSGNYMQRAASQYTWPVIGKATPSEEEPAEWNGPYVVIRVIDGDTAIISIDGEDTTVRFIGIDTPESVNPDESKNTEEGRVASEFTKGLLTDQSVYLEYDIERTDVYGRTLAYLYMTDGRMVQEEILKAGMASLLTIQPNSRYAERLYAAQQRARNENAGFWATGFYF